MNGAVKAEAVELSLWKLSLPGKVTLPTVGQAATTNVAVVMPISRLCGLFQAIPAAAAEGAAVPSCGVGDVVVPARRRRHGVGQAA